MRDLVELNDGVKMVLKCFKKTDYSLDEQIVILRSAATQVSEVMTTEVLVKSLSITLKNLHGGK